MKGNSNQLTIKVQNLTNNRRNDNYKSKELPDHKHKIGKKTRKNSIIITVVEELPHPNIAGR